MTQKLTDQVVTQLNDLPGFPARPNTVPPAPDRWVLGEWLVECHVNPEVANAAALPLTDNRVGDVRASLADQLWFIWDGAAWQSMAGGGGAVASVTASAPIASSGGANPDISFPTWPANAAGSLSNDGAGNLSWAAASAVASVTASAPIASSGGANPDISFPTWPANAAGSLSNDGAGNLSWSAAGGITGSGDNGYLTLWNGTSTVTGINDSNTNAGLLWKVNPNAINALGVRGYAFFGPDNGSQIWLEVPGWNYTPPDAYVADVRIQRSNTAYKAGIQFAQFDGGPNALTYNWFFGQVPDSGPQRADGGKIVLYAGNNGTAKPDGTQPFVTFRQQVIGFGAAPGEAIVNENLQDHDFRVAGVTDANTLFVDGSTSNVGVGESAPVNKLTVAGSFGPEIDTTAVSPTTLDGTHYTMLCDTSGGAITVNLPAASTCARRVYVVKNINVNAVTVQANGAETIDGANTYPLAAQWDHVMIQSDGVSAWFVIG
jgi:hypothetical protein